MDTNSSTDFDFLFLATFFDDCFFVRVLVGSAIETTCGTLDVEVSPFPRMYNTEFIHTNFLGGCLDLPPAETYTDPLLPVSGTDTSLTTPNPDFPFALPNAAFPLAGPNADVPLAVPNGEVALPRHFTGEEVVLPLERCLCLDSSSSLSKLGFKRLVVWFLCPRIIPPWE